MSESDFADLRGKEFERADMAGARFTTVSLNGATLRACALNRVVMRGVELVEAELDRRHPDRPRFRPTTPEGFREAWDLNERLWEATVARARRLDPERLHASVGGEWSFIQTLRHLAFATESWVSRAVLGNPSPWHPLSLPWDQMSPRPGVPHDREARPSLDEALALRLTAMATVRRVVDGLTDEQLDSRTEPLEGPGWPDEGDTFPVRECLLVVLNEEWWHRMYAERDLAVLEQGD